MDSHRAVVIAKIAPTVQEEGTRVMPLWYPMIDAGSLSAHLVSEGSLAAGRRAGRFQAVCGDTVLAASLTAQERTHCQMCAHLCRGAQR